MPQRGKSLHELAGSGDDGTTGLLGGGRVPKTDARIEAYGTVDEASSALGLAKGLTKDARVRDIAEHLQRDLYRLGAELATNPSATTTFASVGDEDVAALDGLLTELEAEVTMPAGFVLPGQTAASGALDLARTVTRRAERRCLELAAAGQLAGDGPQRYLNRLSLVLFVLARFEEARAGTEAKPARS
ncbi:MAG: cob(I)yrinic acid a,c-diamide adenosyltransferase [Candidatus Dormiibacterota bacterium]